MRLWSLHPSYLDPRGLVALWREALLAQAVLKGRTSGYTRHPQLLRFLDQPSPAGAIAEYLRVVHRESVIRGYCFAASRIGRARTGGRLVVTRGQLAFEWEHLMNKLGRRAPEWRTRLGRVRCPKAHPAFTVVRGAMAGWEKGGERSPAGPHDPS